MKNGRFNIRFNLGLIISMAIVLVAFEWKTYYFTIRETHVTEEEFYDVPEEYIPLKIEKPEKPEPIKKEPEKKPEAFKIIEDYTQPKQEEAKAEIGQRPDVPVIPEFKDELVDEDLPFVIVEQMPQYPGGEKAMLEYIYSKVRYLEKCKEARIQGTVHAKFVVGVTGKTENIEIMRGLTGCPEMDQQVYDAIANMPPWIPGVQAGRKVRVIFSLPVNFKLK